MTIIKLNDLYFPKLYMLYINNDYQNAYYKAVSSLGRVAYGHTPERAINNLKD